MAYVLKRSPGRANSRHAEGKDEPGAQPPPAAADDGDEPDEEGGREARRRRKLRKIQRKLSETKRIEDSFPFLFPGVAGMHSAKKAIFEHIFRPLMNPELLEEYKIRQEKGILLYGPPGVGKTFIIKVLAEQCELNFIHKAATEFFSSYFGGTEDNIRTIFEEAKDGIPSIIFIDEFDAVGMKRGAVAEEAEWTDSKVNQFLTLMDGFEPLQKIVVIAATNCMDKIDGALLRPGRFGVHIGIDLPDQSEREECLDLDLRERPVAKDVSVVRLARITEQFTYAELSQLVDNSARAALERKSRGLRSVLISQGDLVDAILDIKKRKGRQ